MTHACHSYLQVNEKAERRRRKPRRSASRASHITSPSRCLLHPWPMNRITRLYLLRAKRTQKEKPRYPERETRRPTHSPPEAHHAIKSRERDSKERNEREKKTSHRLNLLHIIHAKKPPANSKGPGKTPPSRSTASLTDLTLKLHSHSHSLIHRTCIHLHYSETQAGEVRA